MIDHRVITETLVELLPDEAELFVQDNQQQYLATFNWPITGDPTRPHKRSKTVVLKIDSMAMQDLCDIGNKLEAKTLIDLETFLKNQLHTFEPDHTSPKGHPEPIEKWEVTSLHFLNTQKPLKGVKRRMF
jgi:hypothetical protein